MTITGRSKKLLDDKESFLLWVELGSVSKVLGHYNERGLINPRTSLPFSEMAIWMSAMRYVLAHPEEAKPYYEAERGSPYPEDEWEEFLIKRVFQVYNYSKSRTLKWAKRNNLYDKHYPIWAKAFNLPERES